MEHSKPVLVTGATGYVGARLISRLLMAGYRVRAMGRSLAKMKSRSWGNHPMIELAEADILDLPSLERAARGCGTAFYLVHSMIAQKKGFADADRTSARNMVAAAA
ncbi:MAG: NAD(P)H-binding protein, partial [Deltaproteobacteria bacterium]|nr:NAD(P)H-binding protein [Deltaproteobacteria bacterium]